MEVRELNLSQAYQRCNFRRCKQPAVAAVYCGECGTGFWYGRCREHDGLDGAKRSLRSHMGLVHPKSDLRSGT